MRSGLFILFLLCSGRLSPQSDSLAFNRKLYFSISAGASIPLATFSALNKDQASSSYYKNGIISGMAKPGFNYKAEAGYGFSRVFGLVFTFYSSTNKSLPLNYEDLYPAGPRRGGLGSGSYMTAYTYDTKNWKSHAVLGGLTAAAELKKIVLLAKIIAGFLQVRSPDTRWTEWGYNWSMNAPNTDYTSVLFQPCITSNGFITDLGLEIRIQLNKKLAVNFCSDYLNSDVSFNGNLETAYTSGSTVRREGKITFQKNIPLISFYAGILFIVTREPQIRK